MGDSSLVFVVGWSRWWSRLNSKNQWKHSKQWLFVWYNQWWKIDRQQNGMDRPEIILTIFDEKAMDAIFYLCNLKMVAGDTERWVGCGYLRSDFIVKLTNIISIRQLPTCLTFQPFLHLTSKSYRSNTLRSGRSNCGLRTAAVWGLRM